MHFSYSLFTLYFQSVLLGIEFVLIHRKLHTPWTYFDKMVKSSSTGGSYLLMKVMLMPWIIYNVSIWRNRKWILIVFCYIFVIRLLRSVMASSINCWIVRGQGAPLKNVQQHIYRRRLLDFLCTCCGLELGDINE